MLTHCGLLFLLIYYSTITKQPQKNLRLLEKQQFIIVQSDNLSYIVVSQRAAIRIADILAAGHVLKLYAVQFNVCQFCQIRFGFFFCNLTAFGLSQCDQFVGGLALHHLFNHFFCDFVFVDLLKKYKMASQTDAYRNAFINYITKSLSNQNTNLTSKSAVKT